MNFNLERQPPSKLKIVLVLRIRSYTCIRPISSSKSSTRILKLIDIPAIKLTKSMNTIEMWLLKSAILFRCGFIARFARMEDIRDVQSSLFKFWDQNRMRTVQNCLSSEPWFKLTVNPFLVNSEKNSIFHSHK